MVYVLWDFLQIKWILFYLIYLILLFLYYKFKKFCEYGPWSFLTQWLDTSIELHIVPLTSSWYDVICCRCCVPSVYWRDGGPCCRGGREGHLHLPHGRITTTNCQMVGIFYLSLSVNLTAFHCLSIIFFV